jgi:hypothetical protein
MKTNTIITQIFIYLNLSKREYSIRNGYNFLFIIDKDYSEFENTLFSFQKNKDP